MSEKKVYKTAEFLEPTGNQTKLGQLWCPYEGEWKMFTPRKFGEGYGYPRCEGCGISTEDWFVKKVNGMFESLGGKKKKKK